MKLKYESLIHQTAVGEFNRSRYQNRKAMKKIMFNDEYGLTQAVLDGRKTQTRRIVPQRIFDNIRQFQEEYYDATFDTLEDTELLNHFLFTEKRHGRLTYNVGEVVAVAQSYKDAGVCFIQCDFIPKHNRLWGHTENMKGWTNKMFVQAETMPHQIRINDVRVERLQDISDEDCLKEGLEWDGKASKYYVGYAKGTGKKNWLGDTPREAFAHLINKVSRKDVWNENPYVFVYDFELVK